MVVEIYTTKLVFKGVVVSVSIKPTSGEEYEVLIRSKQKLDEDFRRALMHYLDTEGYISESHTRFE
tara:strand:+ start:739 stop:936 length:198 start_codon:yes stop_codon:yes gene_type:complete